MTDPAPAASPALRWPLWLVLLAGAGVFALTMGTRQTMGLFLGPLNSATGLGLSRIEFPGGRPPAGARGATGSAFLDEAIDAQSNGSAAPAP